MRQLQLITVIFVSASFATANPINNSVSVENSTSSKPQVDITLTADSRASETRDEAVKIVSPPEHGQIISLTDQVQLSRPIVVPNRPKLIRRPVFNQFQASSSNLYPSYTFQNQAIRPYPSEVRNHAKRNIFPSFETPNQYAEHDFNAVGYQFPYHLDLTRPAAYPMPHDAIPHYSAYYPAPQPTLDYPYARVSYTPLSPPLAALARFYYMITTNTENMLNSLRNLFL